MTRSSHILLAISLAALLPGSAIAQQSKVLVVKTSDAPVIEDLAAGFKSYFPSAASEEVLVSGDTADASLGAKVAAASAVLSVGAKAAVMVAKLHPAAPTIAVVPPTQADPASQGSTLRLQPSADGVIGAVAWMGAYRRIGFITDASQKERIELAKVAAIQRDLTLVPAPVTTSREVITAVQALMGKIDLLVVDVTDGLDGRDVQFILKTAGDQGVPVVGTSEGFLRAGAPIAVAIDPRNVGAEAGRLASQKAVGLFDPKRFRVLVNLVATQRLGMTVPQDKGIVENNILTLDTDGSDLAKGAAHGKPIVDGRPSVLRQARPVFPNVPSAIRSAEVVVEVTVKADGSLADTKVLKGDPAFSSAALDSLKEWQFKPATKDGAPVDGTLRLNLKFQR